jgi:putative DNA primase/helicase
MVERAARPGLDGEVAAYLRNRGLEALLDDFPADVLEHPPTACWEWPRKLGEFAMMLGVIRSAERELINVHRTYLQNGAKAPVLEPKKLGSRKVRLSGSAIRLYEATDRLALAEGIESALAVRAMTGLPTWSCVSAALMPHVHIPETVRVLDIYADHDQAGLTAAELLRKRVEASGVIVEVHVPPAEGADPLDWYLLQQGKPEVGCLVLAAPAERERQLAQQSRRLSGDRCKCSVCGTYFNSTAAFDEHRTGPHGKGRRCMTSNEMEARGMRLSADDWWLTSH